MGSPQIGKTILMLEKNCLANPASGLFLIYRLKTAINLPLSRLCLIF